MEIFVLIDGFEGIAIVNPTQTTLFRYGKVGLSRKKMMDLLQEEESLPSLTKDGEKVVFLANADSADEVRKAHRHGCEGVGLFRTESVFLEKTKFLPKMSNLRSTGKSSKPPPSPVTIRTLDLGGDKILDSIGREKEGKSFHGIPSHSLLPSTPRRFP